MIDELREKYCSEDVPIALIYLDYTDETSQESRNILGSIIGQLALTGPAIRDKLLSFYQRVPKARKQPQTRDLLAWLTQVSQECERISIAIDAIDECDEGKHRQGLLDILSHFRTIPNLKVFATSRSYPEDIRNAFEAALQLTVKADQRDIERFLWRRIHNCANVDMIDEALQVRIVSKLSHGAQNM